MLLKAFTIRDTKAEVFNTPFFQKTHGEAERSFKKLATDPQSMVGQYPDDYDLYYIGEYDDQTGKLIVTDSPQHVAKAIMVKST